MWEELRGIQERFFLQDHEGSMNAKKMGLDSASEDMGVLFFDANGDGDQDLYVSSGGTAQENL